MAGQFLNKKISQKERSSMVKIISKWQKAIFILNPSWQTYNLHVDEISKCFESRSTWLEAGLFCLQLLQEKSKNNLLPIIPFVHFPLKDSRSNKPIMNLSEKIIKEKLHGMTPPSLMYNDKKYLSGELLQQLTKCTVSSTDSFLTSFNYHFYFRAWYDTRDKVYSLELYAFLIPLESLK